MRLIGALRYLVGADKSSRPGLVEIARAEFDFAAVVSDAPAIEDVIYRAGAGLLEWDGTRWLGGIETVSMSLQGVLMPLTASGTVWGAIPHNPGGAGWMLLDAKFWIYVNSGTAHDAGNNFSIQFGSSDAGTDTPRGSAVSTSGKAVADHSDVVSVNVVLASTVDRLYIANTMTGAPSSIYITACVRVRPVYAS